jgi:hypothetical protein
MANINKIAWRVGNCQILLKHFLARFCRDMAFHLSVD